MEVSKFVYVLNNIVSLLPSVLVSHFFFLNFRRFCSRFGFIHFQYSYTQVISIFFSDFIIDNFTVFLSHLKVIIHRKQFLKCGTISEILKSVLTTKETECCIRCIIFEYARLACFIFVLFFMGTSDLRKMINRRMKFDFTFK